MFNDEYLGYWGAAFTAARRLEPGIRLQVFWEDSWGSYRPLSPRRRRVTQAFWRHWEPEADSSGPVTPEADARLTLVTEEECNP